MKYNILFSQQGQASPAHQRPQGGGRQGCWGLGRRQGAPRGTALQVCDSNTAWGIRQISVNM